VLAVSCRTGKFELVGVYHAGYARGSALNVVVGIDQIRDLMTTLKRSPRPRTDGGPVALDARARTELTEALSTLGTQYFPFGQLTASAFLRSDGAILFFIHSRDFPLRASPALALEDLPSPGDGFGAPGRVLAGNRQGLRGIPRSELDADAQGQLARLLDALRRDAIAVLRYRVTARGGMATRERFEKVARLERAARSATSARVELAQAALDLAARLCPETADAPVSVADLLALPPADPSPPAAQPVPASAPATAVARPDPGGAGVPAAHAQPTP
jgi:serine protease Do